MAGEFNGPALGIVAGEMISSGESDHDLADYGKCQC